LSTKKGGNSSPNAGVFAAVLTIGSTPDIRAQSKSWSAR
jgi:hypothetical protein